MQHNPQTLPSGTPYGEFLAERDEIMRLKWIESEQQGRDVGFEHALNVWASKHRAQWRRVRNGNQAATEE